MTSTGPTSTQDVETGQSDASPPPYKEAAESSPLQPSSATAVSTGAPPPSYDSVFGELKAAKQNSSTSVEFFKAFIVILFGTVGCTIMVGVFLAIPITMIVMGSVYLDDCPRQKYIPIYLIVGGCFGLLKNLSDLAQRIKNQTQDQRDQNAKPNPFDGTLDCFLFIWFIAGNVWIYGTYNDFTTDDPNDPKFCDYTLYYFAFWLMTASYIFMLCSCLSCCCLGLFVACGGSRSAS